MSFLWPVMLLLLVLVPLCVWLYIRLQRRRRQLVARYGSLGLVQAAAGRPLGARRHIPIVLFLVGLTILLFALARPQTTVSLPRAEGTVMLVFDVSGSMAAEDIQPSRMEAAKTAAREFVQRQPRSVQVGVVAFSDSGLTVQAPTNDQEAVLSAINRLSPQRGTSLGQGMLAALTTIAMGANQSPRYYTNLTPTPLPSPTIDPIVARIRDAATSTIAAKSVGFDASLTYAGNVAIPDGTTVTTTGGLSFGVQPQVLATTDASALGLGITHVIIDDQQLYIAGSVLTSRLKAGQWLVVDLQSRDPRAIPFLQVTKGQNDSALVLYDLFGAQAPIAYVASEDIDAVTTDHFQFNVDLEAAPSVVPDGVRDHLLDAIAALRAAGIARTLDGQVWAGPDGLVHRVTYTYTLGPVVGGGHITVTYTLRDFGRPLVLGIPNASDLVHLEDLKP